MIGLICFGGSLVFIGIIVLIAYIQINNIHPLKAIANFFSKHWFKIIFSLCAAILGFIIMNNKIGGKIMGAILFFAMGLGFAWILNSWIKMIKNKTVIIILEVVLCVLLGIFTVTREYVTYHAPTKKYYDKYGNSYYNKEDRDNANFLYDAYDAADKYR